MTCGAKKGKTVMKKENDTLYIRVRDMFTIRAGVRTCLPAALAFSVYLIGGAWLMNGRLALSGSFRGSNLIVVLFVGVTEETVFRGWLLNASVRESKKWPPVLLNALLFLLIHFPAWIAGGSFAVNFSRLGFVCLLALSLVFSWSFLKSKSLWVPIALHMYWDLLCFLLY